MDAPEAVYIMFSRPRGVLYTGRTKDLIRRVWQHRTGLVRGFTKRHSIVQLGYWEAYGDWREAWRRERQIKRYPRDWKFNLIERKNPNWKDLWYSITEQDENPAIPQETRGRFDPSLVIRPEKD
mgnify:CR=1 FL=1